MYHVDVHGISIPAFPPFPPGQREAKGRLLRDPGGATRHDGHLRRRRRCRRRKRRGRPRLRVVVPGAPRGTGAREPAERAGRRCGESCWEIWEILVEN